MRGRTQSSSIWGELVLDYFGIANGDHFRDGVYLGTAAAAAAAVVGRELGCGGGAAGSLRSQRLRCALPDRQFPHVIRDASWH